MMKREILGIASAMALMTGVAFAEDAQNAPAAQPPAATNAPAVTDQGKGTTADATQPASPAASTTAQQPPAQPPASDMAQQPSAQPPTNATAQQPPAQPPASDMAQQPPAAQPSTDTAQAPAAEPAKAATASAAEKTGEPVSGNDVIGHKVTSNDGKDLGKVADVVVDSASGKIETLVVSSGGFLGIGAKKVAIPFDEVELRPEGGIVATKLTQKDIESLPEFDTSKQVKSLDKTSSASAGSGAGPTAPMGSTAGTGAGSSNGNAQ